MNNCFILLAAGQSKRFKSSKHKQFISYKNKPLYEHSIIKAIESKLFKKIILVTNKRKIDVKKFKNKVKIIKGGKERSDSSFLGIKYAKKLGAKNVFIHDAARPNFSINLLKNISKSLKKNQAVVPFINSSDSIKYKTKLNYFNLNRKNILKTQTPQAFRLENILKLSKNNKSKVNDEATLFINQNYKVKFIPGENKNNKITYVDDLNDQKIFYGLGFDIHRLVRKKKLYLGGIKIPYHSGLAGHSDGDVILHSIIDAILGSIRKKDIGTYFPNTKKFKNIRSTKLLKPILEMLDQANFYINNLDINLICQKPRVSKYRNRIVESISRLMNLNKDLINLKGKTVEKLGLIGKEKAIACEVIISIAKYD